MPALQIVLQEDNTQHSAWQRLAHTPVEIASIACHIRRRTLQRHVHQWLGGFRGCVELPDPSSGSQGISHGLSQWSGHNISVRVAPILGGWAEQQAVAPNAPAQ